MVDDRITDWRATVLALAVIFLCGSSGTLQAQNPAQKKDPQGEETGKVVRPSGRKGSITRGHGRPKAHATSVGSTRPSPHPRILLMSLDPPPEETCKNQIDIHKKQVSTKPDGLSENRHMAYWYYKCGQYAEAANYYKQAVALKSTDAQMYHFLGCSYYNSSQYSEAAESLQQAAQLKSVNGGVLYDLGLAYIKLGNRSAALEQHKILKTLNPTLARHLRRVISAIPTGPRVKL